MLTVLTWNVWFGGHRFEERCAALCAEIGAADADVVALQEVTVEFLAYLRAAPWADRYHFSDETGETLGDYGVLLLTRARMGMMNVVLHELPSVMGRSLLLADVEVGATQVTVGTVHLESLGEASRRAEQLRRCFGRLARRRPEALLVGDFNFCPGDQPETTALDPAFRDVWAALHPDDPGYTVDSERNRMRWLSKQKLSQKRIDRVMARGALAPAGIDLVGTSPVGGDPELWPSDHFGLCARFSGP